MTTSSKEAFTELLNARSFDTISLEHYEVIVKEISKNSLNVPIQNKDSKHAAILMKHIYNATEKEINLYVNFFSGIYSSQPDYISSLKDCLLRNVNINVILDQKPNLQSEAYNLIKDYIINTKKGKIGIATEKTKEIISEIFENNTPLHFAVSDSKRYRIETDPKLKTAYSHFNDNEMASNLNSTFYLALSTCKLI